MQCASSKLAFKFSQLAFVDYDTIRRQFFLRGDGITSLKHEDIAKELAVISCDGTIEYLSMKTFGKEEDNA